MQENTKQVTVKMTARRCFRTEPIYQYDVGHVLTFEGFGLPTAFEVHFARSPLGKAVTQIGTDGTCTLPDMFAQTAGVIYAWLYIADADSGLTKYSIEIPVAKRAQITNQEPTPVEQSAIDQAIAALNAGVERSETAADAAESAQEAAEGYAESAGNSAITATNAANSAASAKTAAETAARNAATSATDANASRQAADQSATNAGVSESNAAASASAATGSATSAATSAGQASASATAASGSASTASTKASEAAQSATAAAGSAASASEAAGTASTAATAAEQSATAAAGSATAAAGSATSAGQSATAAAGSAQAAQDVLDSIPADYSELSDDVDTLKSAITELEPVVDDLKINKADVIISSASGAIASFFDGGDGLPVKELTVGIEPVQDLHGYDSPWPAGGGKNVFYHEGNLTATANGLTATFDGASQTISITGTNTGTSAFILLSIACTGDIPRETPLARALINAPSGVYANFAYRKNGAWVGVNNGDVIPADTDEGAPINFQIGILTSVTTLNATGIHIQIERGSTAPTAWTPYSNICPISGWDGVNVTRTGKNLLSPHLYKGIAYNPTIGAEVTLTDSAQQLTDNGDGTFSISTTSSWSYFALVWDRNQTKDYYLKIGISSTANLGVTYGNILNGKIYSKANSTVTTQNLSIHVEPWDIYGNAQGYIVFTPRSSSSATITITEPQVELGSTATAYEPYSGQTYSIALPSEAGTVYGGELTVNEDGTGTLAVDRKHAQMTSSFINSRDSSSIGFRGTVSQVGGNAVWVRNWNYTDCPKIIYGGIKAISNAFPVSMHDRYIYTSQYRVYFGVGSMTTLDEFKEAVEALEASGSGLYLCYELATPQTYTLTAAQVTTLLGTNNVWADAGDVSVLYRADTKLYIEQLTKPTEDDMTANTAITSGKFFMVGNRLFLATAAIASGAMIIPGTNCTELSLADALNNINA